MEQFYQRPFSTCHCLVYIFHVLSLVKFIQHGQLLRYSKKKMPLGL